MIKIYGRTTSFNVQKVMWLLEELNLAYEHIQLGGRFSGLDTFEFSKLSPMKKVPLLMDGENIIWESHTILRYLASTYAVDTWYSEGAYERSVFERWMDWSQTMFQPAFMNTFWGFYRKPESKRNMDEVNISLQKCVGCLDTLNEVLKDSKYLTGNKISLGDICAGAVLYRLTNQGLDISLPVNVNRWYEILQSRTGYKKWIMSDFSELKGREDF